MAFLFPDKKRLGGGADPATRRWALGKGPMPELGFRNRDPAALAGGREAAAARAAGVGGAPAEDRPWTDFMRPGPARQAAESQATPMRARARRAARGVRRSAAASVGRVLRGRGAGTIERASVTTPTLEALERDPWSAERVEKLRAYRKRERERKAKARAGKKSVLRGRGRYGTRRSA